VNKNIKEISMSIPKERYANVMSLAKNGFYDKIEESYKVFSMMVKNIDKRMVQEKLSQNEGRLLTNVLTEVMLGKPAVNLQNKQESVSLHKLSI